jgi:RND superfamily putative drug exporter
VSRISIEPPECRATHERLADATDAEMADVLEDELEKERQQDVRDIPG